MAEFRAGGLLFTANFDSANLARVERTIKAEDEEESTPSGYCGGEIRPDYEFNVWTKPDCADTEFENSNRSWFYFGVRGYTPGRIIRINIMNMNRQGKLYSQGHSPFTKTLPGKPRWDRIRDRPTWETVEGQFVLSFNHRFLDFRGSTTYFAFCFPWSYVDSQQQLEELDAQFEDCKSLSFDPAAEKIYYHRELLCHSLEKERIDLITISSCRGIQQEREPRFDKNLFPDKQSLRCHKFSGKRVYFLSSRVHPGETPASYVFNGFLDFILREDDDRAKQLRQQFVFKMIPILNPDGVSQGHYRTDTRGINLNRMYQDPDFALQPSIYAAKSIVVYHHVSSRVKSDKDRGSWELAFPGGFVLKVVSDNKSTSKQAVDSNEPNTCVVGKSDGSQQSDDTSASNITEGTSPVESFPCVKLTVVNAETKACVEPSSSYNRILPPLREHSPVKSSHIVEPLDLSGLMSSVETFPPADKMDKSRLMSSSDSSIMSANEMYSLPKFNYSRGVHVNAQMSSLTVTEKNPLHLSLNKLDSDSGDDMAGGEIIGNEGSDDEGKASPSVITNTYAAHLSDPNLLLIPPHQSGIALYVDLHGHASKRGCFIYGNYLESEDMQVENMLFPKLISLNTAHFDFTGCNFTERNMYLKDRRDGMSKEGSGRVAVMKAIGIIHSYTLECNYNTGRMVNSVPAAYGDNGRATPPPLAGFPPKYTQAHYEDVGKALAVAALDMTDSNPWSRLTLSEYSCLQGTRDAVRRYLRGLRGGPRLPRNTTRTIHRNTSSTGVTSQTTVKGAAASGQNNTPVKSNPNRRSSVNCSLTKRELAPVREVNRPTANSRRRMTVPCYATATTTTNQVNKMSSLGSQTVPITLSMTTVTSDAQVTVQRQTSAGSSIYSIEEEKVEKLRNIPDLTTRQKTPSRIPIFVNRPLLNFTDPTSLDNAPSSQSLNKYPERFHHRTIQPLTSPRQAMVNNLMQTTPTASDIPLCSDSSSGSLYKKEKPPTFETGFGPIRPHPESSHHAEPPKSDPPKRRSRRLSQVMKRRSLSHSPKTNSGKGSQLKQGSGNMSEVDKRPRRRRRRSQRKASIASPSSEDAAQAAPLVRENALQGSSVTLSPRHTINSSDLCHPCRSNRHRHSKYGAKPLPETSHTGLVNYNKIELRPIVQPGKISVYWLDPYP